LLPPSSSRLQSPTPPALRTVRLELDRTAIGRIIGKGGATVTLLRSQSQARITINSTTAVVTITGTAEAARKAEELVKAAAARKSTNRDHEKSARVVCL
jgi:rRNA processing protein Krr1/Pno1